jgi:hypothetical protein
LCFGNCRKGSDLAIVKAGVFAIVLQAHFPGIDPVKLSQSANSIVPPVTDINKLSRISRYDVPTFLSSRQV